MALVKILVKNLFAGANFQKLEVGQSYDVDDAVAEKWIASGKAEKSTEKKGEKLVFEVATPSSPVSSNAKALQDQIDALTKAAEEAEAAHAEAIAEVTKRAEEAEAALAAATKKDK
ncbi:hypothetical protein [Rahnella inusitata]|uniref:hypothetical protein n=1 Tax=Rahnella inusitata TaxID=58169 RepID=UPI0039BE11A7